jgi:hypothetical protein
MPHVRLWHCPFSRKALWLLHTSETVRPGAEIAENRNIWGRSASGPPHEPVESWLRGDYTQVVGIIARATTPF